MSALTESLSHLVDKWHREEPTEDWWKWQHDVASALVAMEAQEIRIAELENDMRYIVKQWSDSSAAKTARASLERKL